MSDDANVTIGRQDWSPSGRLLGAGTESSPVMSDVGLSAHPGAVKHGLLVKQHPTEYMQNQHQHQLLHHPQQQRLPHAAPGQSTAPKAASEGTTQASEQQQPSEGLSDQRGSRQGSQPGSTSSSNARQQTGGDVVQPGQLQLVSPSGTEVRACGRGRCSLGPPAAMDITAAVDE